MTTTTRPRQPTDIVICHPLRTPVGALGGALAEHDAATLAATVVSEIMNRSGLAPELIGDVILGHAYPNGEAPAIGRVVALDAGLGSHVPGTQVDRRCGSGLQAIIYGALHVAAGASEIVLAGGVESMSNVEHYVVGFRSGTKATQPTLRDRLARARVTAGGKHHLIHGGMIETAENLRERYGVTRTEQDYLALRSQQATARATADGGFKDEIVLVGTRGGDVVEDEHPRPDTTLEGLARLRPVMHDQIDAATVTAGNSSGQNDGAALGIVTTREAADRYGLAPLVTLRCWTVTGVAPELMGLGPVAATNGVLRLADLTLDDIELIELNEAFAVQVLACLLELGLDRTDPRINVNGSGIALGHPIGATGARLVATLAHQMNRQSADTGLVTMCIGGGQGLAAIFERA